MAHASKPSNFQRTVTSSADGRRVGSYPPEAGALVNAIYAGSPNTDVRFVDAQPIATGQNSAVVTWSTPRPRGSAKGFQSPPPARSSSPDRPTQSAAAFQQLVASLQQHLRLQAAALDLHACLRVRVQCVFSNGPLPPSRNVIRFLPGRRDLSLITYADARAGIMPDYALHVVPRRQIARWIDNHAERRRTSI